MRFFAESGLINQAMVNGVQREFEAVRNAELIENVVKMIFYGLLTDEKFFADFLVTISLRDQLYNFLFTIAEQRLLAPRTTVG